MNTRELRRGSIRSLGIIASLVLLILIPCTSGAANQVEERKLPASVPDVWKAIQWARIQLDQTVSSGQMDRMEAEALWLRDLVGALPKLSKLSKDSAARLNEASTSVAEVASTLGKAGKAADKDALAAQTLRLDAALKTIKSLYPAELVPDLEFVCPMHSEVRQGKSGRCGKCGMDLVPDAMQMPSPTKAP